LGTHWEQQKSITLPPKEKELGPLGHATSPHWLEKKIIKILA
jgi:hypothetical protein